MVFQNAATAKGAEEGMVKGMDKTDGAEQAKLEAASARAWSQLFDHCRTARGSRPTKKWLREAALIIEVIGEKEVCHAAVNLFAMARNARSDFDPSQAPWNRPEEVIGALKGLVWTCKLLPSTEITRAISALAMTAYRRVPRDAAVGNACVWALGELSDHDGLSQLVILKTRIRTRMVQNAIGKAIDALAKRMGLSEMELEELAVPTYGMSVVGDWEQTFGPCTAEVRFPDSKSEVRWQDHGKIRKSIPHRVKSEFADELKIFKQTIKDIENMVVAQSSRMEQVYLMRRSPWEFDVWCKRYLNHPLIGILARRLIWNFHHPDLCDDGQSEDAKRAMVFHDGRLAGLDGRPFSLKDLSSAKVGLWHPLHAEANEIVAWRERLAELQIRQPFKQAHREVYLLTDAEQHTNLYSNRFAAHILKQHQFHALCQARGWRNKLRLMVDAEFPPAFRELPAWGLRAEFWIDAIGNDFGTDTNESGTFYYLATDQVRFYESQSPQATSHAFSSGYHVRPGVFESEPLSVVQIPAIVFSEVMRDVDLFVGVSSVGNDPNWFDGGPDGRFQDYWTAYSFGELGATARTRKEVLQRLIPRLKIADRCSIADRFLIVQGNLRTYRIHLGSGNILMEPNDVYLCIVPRSSISQENRLFLPFEGDRMMSIILSKALMLAQDHKIKDPTILSQIGSNR